MDNNKPPLASRASREEVQAFFEEEQRITDEDSRKVVAEAAKEAEKAVRKTALNSADILGMINSPDGEVLDWLYSTLTPQLDSVEVLPVGARKRGGGSKGRSKKDKKGNKAYVDPWTDI